MDLVAQVTGVAAVDVLEHLEAAARAGLVTERGSRFAFRHKLVREALVAATGATRRALVHRQAARVLAARPEPDTLAVAVHARAGGDARLASAFFVAAAKAAPGRFDLDAAEEYLAAALDLKPTAEAYATRGRVRMSRLAIDAARADAERATAATAGVDEDVAWREAETVDDGLMGSRAPHGHTRRRHSRPGSVHVPTIAPDRRER